MRYLIGSFLLCALILLPGCHTVRDESDPSIDLYYGNKITKPLLAVSSFENLAGVKGRWNLGEGMADLLIADLMATDHVIVLERKDIKRILEEIIMQGGDLFRREGRVERGRLKNAKFLVRGSVTDFTESVRVRGWFGLPGFRVFGGGNRARVAITLRVSDIETGEIISSLKTAASVSSGGLGAEGRYKNMTFGGDAFFRTPLGKATDIAIRKAVKEILRALPIDHWKARVAEAGSDYVVINGGRNVRVREGDEFTVRKAPRTITDPVTGDVIEVVAGSRVGRIRITKVNAGSSHGVVEEGVARRGDYLEPIDK